jgi:predicted RNase H-like nuclease (RuvC/YqgF family)
MIMRTLRFAVLVTLMTNCCARSDFGSTLGGTLIGSTVGTTLGTVIGSSASRPREVVVERHTTVVPRETVVESSDYSSLRRKISSLTKKNKALARELDEALDSLADAEDQIERLKASNAKLKKALQEARKEPIADEASVEVPATKQAPASKK